MVIKTIGGWVIRLSYHLPNGEYKNQLRSAISPLLPFLPRHFLLDRGDSAVMVGSPNPSKVHTFASLVKDKGEVLFIEPEPTNHQALQEAAREYPYAQTDDRGAWSEPGEQILKLGDETNPGDHKIAVEGVEHDNDYRPENYNQERMIQVERLDAILADYNIKPDYLEVMVNGAELEVLKGATQTLESSSPKLYVKGHPRKDGEPLHEEIGEFLKKKGYRSTITKEQDTATQIDGWEQREGDIFAWKPD